MKFITLERTIAFLLICAIIAIYMFGVYARETVLNIETDVIASQGLVSDVHRTALERAQLRLHIASLVTMACLAPMLALLYIMQRRSSLRYREYAASVERLHGDIAALARSNGDNEPVRAMRQHLAEMAEKTRHLATLVG
jgi:hypothetical protein